MSVSILWDTKCRHDHPLGVYLIIDKFVDLRYLITVSSVLKSQSDQYLCSYCHTNGKPNVLLNGRRHPFWTADYV